MKPMDLIRTYLIIKRVLRCGQNRRWRGACRSPYREYGQGEQRCHRGFWPQPSGTGRCGRAALSASLAIFAILTRSAFAHRARTAAVAHVF